MVGSAVQRLTGRVASADGKRGQAFDEGVDDDDFDESRNDEKRSSFKAEEDDDEGLKEADEDDDRSIIDGHIIRRIDDGVIQIRRKQYLKRHLDLIINNVKLLGTEMKDATNDADKTKAAPHIRTRLLKDQKLVSERLKLLDRMPPPSEDMFDDSDAQLVQACATMDFKVGSRERW